MKEKYITYKLGDRTFNVPESQSQQIESKYPDLTIEMKMGDRVFDVPLSEKSSILNKYGSRLNYAFDKDETENVTSPQPSFAPAEEEMTSPVDASMNTASRQDLARTMTDAARAVGAYRKGNGIEAKEEEPSTLEKWSDVVSDALNYNNPVYKLMDNKSFSKGLGAGLVGTGRGLANFLMMYGMSNNIGNPLNPVGSALQGVNDALGGELSFTTADRIKKLYGQDRITYDDLFKTDNAYRDFAIAAKDLQERLSNDANPQGNEKGFIDLISEGKFEDAFSKGLATTAESLPTTLASYNPYTMVLNTLSMFGNNYTDDLIDNPDTPAWKRGVFALGSAVLEQAVEKFADQIFKYIGVGKVSGELTEELSRDIIEEFAEEGTETVAKRIGGVLKEIGKSAAGEGAEEVITSFGNDALGEALDAIDGDKTYGIRAQWERYKEENPDAKVEDFAWAKGKEYLESFIGGAISGMNMASTSASIGASMKYSADEANKAAIQSAYDEGETMDYADIYDVDDNIKEVSSIVADAFVGEDGNSMLSEEFINGLSSSDAYVLARAEEATPEQSQALLALAEAKARQEGLTKKLDDRINNELNAQRNLIEAAKENGSLTIGTYRDKMVFVENGKVQSDGTVTLKTGENGPLVMYDTKTGERFAGRSEDIVNVSSINADEYTNKLDELFRQEDAALRQKARETMSPLAKFKSVLPYSGKKILVDVGNGVTEVFVQQITPKGEVLIKGKKGDLGGQTFMTIDAATFYDSIFRDDSGNPVVTEVEKGEAAQEQKVETPMDADYRGQTVPALINGIPTDVYVTSQDNQSDTIVYEFIAANGQKRSRSSRIGAFMQAVQQAQDILNASEQETTPEVAVPESTTESVPNVAVPEPPVESTPEVTNGPAPQGEPEQIQLNPEDIDWDVLFEQDPWAYFSELQNQFGDEAIDFINNEISATEEEIAKLEKHKGDSRKERVANLQKKSKLKLQLGTLYEMLNKLNHAPSTEVAPETPVAETPTEVDAPTTEVVEQPTSAEETPVAETPEVTTYETPTEVPVTEAPIADVQEDTPVAETPTEAPVETQPVIPVAPTPVDDPVSAAKTREEALNEQLKRAGIPHAKKRDMAFNAGKAVGDMFATREEYEDYLAIATNLGEYNSDFERGVEESFANRHNSPVNSVSLETEPKGENNGEQGETDGTSGNGPSISDNSGRTDNTGTEGGDKTSPKIGKGKTGKGADVKKVADKYPARKGNATQKLLEDTFGFNKVEIPNSRKETLNTIYDFMMAMSKMLGISPKSIGQGGWLDVGNLRSNAQSSAEHSLLSKVVDQSVVKATIKYKYSTLIGIAHEWWHALDHALSYFETGKGKTTASEIVESKFTGRKETCEAVRQVIKAIKGSGHESRMFSLGFPRRYSDYLVEPSEMAARAFDEYIKAKFADAGIVIQNSEVIDYVAQPTPEEMAVITPAFDNLFKVLKEKEGNNPGTSVLYHIGEEMQPQSDAKRLATEAVLTALDESNIETERLNDEQTEQYLKQIGANPETQFSIDTDKPIFLSNAAIAVMGINQEKATPEQWLKMIDKAGGLKAGEDKWMGLSDWLKAQDAKTLTKQEVLYFINENTVRIEEVNYGEIDYFAEDKKFIEAINDEFKALRAEAEAEGEWIHDAGDIAYEQMIEKYGDDFSIAFGVDLGELYVSNREAASVITGVDLGDEREINETRLGYTTDGLDNKKEIALIVPTIERWNQHDEVHFGDAGEGRAVAWIRFGETKTYAKEYADFYAYQEQMQQKYFPDRRISALSDSDLDSLTAEEKAEFIRLRDIARSIPMKNRTRRKVLVIDEIQSKRHQEGRDKGYSMPIEEYKQRLNALENERAERLKRRTILLRQLTEKYGDDFNSYLKLQDTAYIPNENVMTPEEVQEWYATTQDEIDSAIDNLKKEMHTGVPAAPFEKNWPELAMKRMLRYAAENGYDAVAWTGGAQQAERYNISKSVENIDAEDNIIEEFEDGAPVAKSIHLDLASGESIPLRVDADGNVRGGRFHGNNLSDIIGKELAVKVMQPGNIRLSGEGLRVGGEGMKGFYDKMLPAFMNKYGKKWGVKVSDITLPHVEESGRVMHSVPVNEAMKESVMEGQPMFYKTPNGTVYGWTDGKKIYLTEAGINPNTPIHEYTHLWAKAMMLKNPKGWNSVKQLLKGTPIWDEVINDTNYSNIKNDEDAVASEALSRLSGSKNAAKMEQMAQRMIDEANGTGQKLKARGLIQNMKDALAKFWNWVGVELFGIENFNSIDEITDRVLWDLMNKTDLGELSEGQVETQIVTDPKVIEELEASPKVTGFRNVVQNGDGTFSSPMAYWLQSTKEGAKSRVETAKFELGKWEEAEEHPELVDDNGKVTLVKPNKSTVAGVAYDPYIHNRLEPVNLQFKDAWKRDDLVYVETEVAENDLNDGYHADKALLPVGVHSWSNGDVMLSRYDKPVRVMPWEEVADAWAKRLNGEGVEFDVVPPALRPLLVERGVEILPPHKGMGKDCNDAYSKWKDSISNENSVSLPNDENSGDTNTDNDSRGMESEAEGVQSKESASGPLSDGRRLYDPEGEGISWDDYTSFNPISKRKGESDSKRSIRENQFNAFVGNLTSDERIGLYLFLKEFLSLNSGALKKGLSAYVNTLRANGNDSLADFVEQFVNDELKYREGISSAEVAKHGLLVDVPYPIGVVQQMFSAFNNDQYNETLFDRALKLAKRFGVTISFATRDANGNYIDTYGGYYTDLNHIVLDASLLVGDNVEELCKTIVHELIHSVVARASSIESGRAIDGANQFIDPMSLPKDVLDGINMLKEVYETIKDDDAFNKTYGKKDFQEMLSEISNPMFRALLKAKNVWRKFLNGICKILGIYEASAMQTDALTEIEAALDKIFLSAERGELDAVYASFVGELADGYTLADLQKLGDGPTKTLLTQKALFRTGIDPTDVARESAKQIYDRAVRNIWQEFQRQFQDAYQPVRIAIDAIQQETGNIPIEDYENYILIQNQASSRSRVEIDDFQRKYYAPIIEQINHIIDVIMEQRGWNVKDKKRRAEVYDEVRQYLIAKHGLERNKYYQETKKRPLNKEEKELKKQEAYDRYQYELSRIPSTLSKSEKEAAKEAAKILYEGELENIKTMTTADLRDYSGLTALVGMDPAEWEDAEAEAQKMVDNFERGLGRVDNISDTGDLIGYEQSIEIIKLWERINKATDKTLRHSYESGLISRSQYEQIKSMFGCYIPLRGFDETTAEDVYAYARFEGNRFNPAVHKAEGRTSVADDPIAIIMNMAESEIAQGNKNRAKQALYNFLLNRAITDAEGNETQNSLMQVEDVWYIRTFDENGNEVYTIAAPNHEAGETYEEFEERMKGIEGNENSEDSEEGEESVQRPVVAFKSKKGQVDVGMRFQKPQNRNAHYIYLKVNGVDKAIYINGDPKAADAINGTYQQKNGKFGEKFRQINRLISSTFTNYSLEFTARNFFRDMIYSHINMGIKEKDPAYRKKFRKNWRRNNMVSMIKMLNAYRSGEFDTRELTADEAAFVEFMNNGGQTGYTLIHSVESRKKDLQRAIKRMQKGVEKGGVRDSTAFKICLGWIELLNEASELVTRFAAFKTSRDMGRGVVNSINDAKEITVNFNTKGAQDGTGFMGRIASYFGWSKYFFNASVQGVQNTKAMAQANKLKFCSAVGGIAGLGFCMPLITAAITSLFGGDDEEEYWNIPEYDRQNNICISIGKGKYLKIPLPVGFREVYAIGDMVSAMAFDKKFTRDVGQVGTDIANKIASVILPINPLESSTNGLSIWHTVAYTAAPSSSQFIIQNLSNVDWKGAPLQKEYTYNENDPQWMKAFEGNPDWMKSLSKWCNENIYPYGDYRGMDWSPEKLDNTLSNLFGGIYTVIKKTGNTISMAWNEEERNLSNVPLAGVVLGSGADSDEMYVTDAYFDMKDYYDKNLSFIKRRAEMFGYDLDQVFIDKEGGHHPKMQEIYDNETFDWMAKWYVENKELEKLNKKVKKMKKDLSSGSDERWADVEELNALTQEFNEARRKFVDELIEMD